MSEHKRWDASGWAWELEFLVLFFVLLGFILPLLVGINQPVTDPDTLTLVQRAAQDEPNALEELNEVNLQMRALLGGLIVVGLYIGHLLIAGASLSFISTPVVYLFSPVVFAGVTYYRLLNHTTLQGEAIPLVSGSMLEHIGYPILIFAATVMLARFRMKRQLKDFGGIEWIYETTAYYDKGWLSHMGSTLMPFLYPPREIKVCNEGVLIRGSLYIIPLSFHHIQSVMQTKRRSALGNSLNLSTSGHNPVRIQTTESRQPLMITPKDAEAFVAKCAELNPSASRLFSSSSSTVHD